MEAKKVSDDNEKRRTEWDAFIDQAMEIGQHDATVRVGVHLLNRYLLAFEYNDLALLLGMVQTDAARLASSQGL